MVPGSPPHLLLLGAAALLLLGVQLPVYGKMFVLRTENGTSQRDLPAALCSEQGARLATAEELRRAVEECAFSECTTGWITGSRIGITMCNNIGFGQQDHQTVRVKIKAASSTGHYDSFCIKDQGKPCGDPPSFPNTLLQGHTGTEMGDELLYICAQGYVMANGENAFSLLCDSCGEWYGFVQVCVKDPNEQGRVTVSENGGKGVDDDNGSIGEDSRETLKPTESPVSLLSQKHLFWFPSEVFPNTNQPDTKEPDMESEIQITSSDNQIGVKTDATKGVQTAEDLPEPSIVHNETKVTKATVASTNESWVDGYPIVPETEEETEKVDGSMEIEDETTDTSDHSNHIEISRPDTPGTTSATHYTQIVSIPTELPDQGVKQVDRSLTPTTDPETVSTSKAIEDDNFYITTIANIGTDGSWKSSDEITEPSPSPMSTVETVSEGLYPVDHVPIPTKTDEISTHHTLTLGTLEASTGTLIDFTEIDMYDGFTKRENFRDGTEAKLLPTIESCRGEGCTHSSKGPIIAVIVTVIGLLVLAVILAVWCYRRRHQKTSVYQMNGRGQVRCSEHIEMQHKV
ncbi:sushi domain-containing protein 5 isoform X2 [Scyliorhinus canicula]|uniref:sushi domain-containing protein 5 isoform X2 n=1 Tax=Scyliorhinus canicula TaxID=7830 RepID=UPI0018F750DA|nr:sushi domain-containing protein 5 isoform X2 [Scyliorhinus canicula]